MREGERLRDSSGLRTEQAVRCIGQRAPDRSTCHPNPTHAHAPGGDGGVVRLVLAPPLLRHRGVKLGGVGGVALQAGQAELVELGGL